MRTIWTGKHFSAVETADAHFVVEHSNDAQYMMLDASDAIATARSWNARKAHDAQRRDLGASDKPAHIATVLP